MQRFLVSVVTLLVSVCPLFAESAVVLPFSNLSKDRNLDWIGESIAEMVHEAISSEGLLVLDREDRAEAYKRLRIRPYALLTRASVVKMGDELDASHVVYGSFEVKREQDGAPLAQPAITIRARVLDLRKLRQSEEFTETGHLDDLGSLQNQLCWQVVNGLVPQRGTREEYLSKRGPVRVDAMESYVRGLMATDTAQKHRLFTQAARLDANFSQPCFQLGLLHWDQEAYREAASWFKRVGASDAHFRQANFLLGICRYQLADYAGAEESFRLVAQTVPLNEVFNNLGVVQLRRNSPEAIANLQKALEGDDADPDYHFNVGYAHWREKRFDAAADEFRAVLDRVPDDAEALKMLGRALKKEALRPGDIRTEGLERVKDGYNESVYRQLKSMIEKK